MQTFEKNNHQDYSKWTMAAALGNGPIAHLEKIMGQRLQPFRFLTVNSACNGLTAVLRTLQPPGKIICPLFCSPRAYAAIGHSGHKAYFFDVDEEGNLDPFKIDEQLKYAEQVRGLLAVASFGSWPDLQNLKLVADSLDVPLIGDFAQGFLSALLDPQNLALCSAVIFSTSPTKWAGLPDGGLVGCDQALYYKLVNQTMHPLRQLLQVPDKPPNFHYHDCRLNPHTAVALLKILEHIDRELDEALSQQVEFIANLEQHSPFRFQQERPAIYEPLTVMVREPLRPAPPAWFQLSSLQIPDRSNLGRRYNLPETVKQFKYRKVIESA